ncbi:MAG: CoA transferase [Fusobacteriaceae bacterium]|jgi:crotonobetainyl-CoA:carnitine CoA-transferase CaiB-like acyl-CoA transferase|nr:CoA transferase [Fusobacteriaceae bacterium]
MGKALQNLKILDFSTLLPGPLATMHLGDLGAEVLRVTTGTRQDILERQPPLIAENGCSAVTAQLNRNKRSILLNLREPEAVEIVKRLIQDYDILIEQFRPGVMKRLGLDYDTLSAIQPGLIYCSITGYGHGNSMSQRAGHDINYLALGGVSGYSGTGDMAPQLTGIQIADLAGGSCNAIIGILAAVIHRMETGKGQFIDISMTDGVMALNAIEGAACLVTGQAPKPGAALLNGGTIYDNYATKDGKTVSFGGLEEKFKREFCKRLGHDEWADSNIEGDPAVKAEIRAIIKGKTLAEWKTLMADADCCFEPVLDLNEVFESRLARERQMVVDVPVEGGGTVRQIGSPFKFSETPASYVHAGRAASLGETREVLRGFSYTDAEIDGFISHGALK